MSEIALELDSISIEDEMKQSYLDYAMSVIVGRALPDVRDGLKPVHRRVLYAMRELGNSWNSPYKKSARIVGDVIGKYHPHGDTAVYDTMVRMAQPFSMRYMLVDGQGNFGSVDGDPPAAMRYTEVRMAKIAHEMLADLDKETVDFIPNYDESESEPAVLPTKFPALLVNGSSGIAVGMATNIPPHNLTEILNACIAIIDDPSVTTRDLMEFVPGPDFPTAGIINGANGIAEAYETGRGRVYMRARAEIETNEATGQQSIIVHELPYQVNKARLLEKIAELVKEKKIEGISALRDESDKDGMRMVVVIKRGDVPEVILNNLYQQTQLQTVFGINMVAIVDGQPRTLGLKPILEAFIRHRREVVTRRSIYELRKARDRAHILEGLATALANIDEVIELIKASPSPSEAREALLSQGWRSEMILEMLGAAGAQASRPEDLAAEFGLVEGQYYLSPVQAQAILDMRLHRLTGLEQDKILQEYREVLDQIRDLLAILSDPDNLMAVIRQELVAINDEYGDNRRTEILDTHLDLTLEDLITEEEMVVTLSHAGYAKTQQLDTYQAQRRGGKGKAATSMKDEDFIEHLFIANTHDTLLCFSSTGKVYWKKVYELPQGGRTARGKPIVNLLPLEENERINAVLPIREFEADKFIFMATASGTVKKTPLVDYSRPRANGIIAVDLKDDDKLVGVALTDGESDVMLFSSNGKVIRFPETDVRSMGRVSRGVRGMRLADGEQIISLIIAQQEGAILTATEFGYGKRTNLEEYRVQGRGGQGIISIQTSARNGQVVGAVQVCDEDQIMLITNGGTLVRTPVKHVSLVGRNTQGVRLINLSNEEKLVGLERVIEDEDQDIDDLPHTDDLTEE
ncbi:MULTISPECIES: DNA gyrase subunit A [unclassified Methylophaga]|jgi:DNA gyrase subunit A|uniref:DNA gyrase subunit A n=2 Tax=Methylophaga TaxID=40222 RepID=UPI000C5706B2|nr:MULTISPECIES: DNA gyrase subunit A [unclassified Methylophaga]MAL50288.1 DNA gyrase subunit A [Methylophaga sp.]MAP25742.1 DNA gyrase subunit A [Methylophaga sp.]MBP25102.1 DNA gyrase subunit A [Methylophaga sp.]HCO00611.1 DNA gyrase subunit A [Methylophaga sp.]|tara:strand:- start:13817 stop:16396 length:2580 start_codon:yes stop_codon:yes gene_type:complete